MSEINDGPDKTFGWALQQMNRSSFRELMENIDKESALQLKALKERAKEAKVKGIKRKLSL
jgi:hypothetical protein